MRPVLCVHPSWNFPYGVALVRHLDLPIGKAGHKEHPAVQLTKHEVVAAVVVAAMVVAAVVHLNTVIVYRQAKASTE